MEVSSSMETISSLDKSTMSQLPLEASTSFGGGDCAIKGCNKIAIYTKDNKWYCTEHYSKVINGIKLRER